MNELIFMCFVLFFSGIVAEDVPVIIWGPHVEHKDAAALKSHNGEEFIDILTEHLTSDTVTFIIAEDQLAIEDLSQCRAPDGQTCFKGIQKIKSKLYLPTVEDPAPYIKDLFGLDIVEVSLLPSGNFSEPLNFPLEKYILVNFGGDVEDETKSEKLTRHDQMITSFYKDFLLQNGPDIVIVFTGMESTHQKRVVREVLYNARADPSTDSTTDLTTVPTTNLTTTTTAPTKDENTFYWFGNENLLIYCNSMMVKWSDNMTAESFYFGINVTTVATLEEYISRNETYAANETISYAIHYTVTSPNNTFEFIITTKRGYWCVQDFKLNDEPLFSNELISAAEGFSYHCTHKITLADPNRTVIVTYEGLQLQPDFAGVNGTLMQSFGDAYDCVGFVTPVILSGLFVTFLLLFVLFIGILCILDIKPIDRFDDPKGKTITVTSDG